MAYALASFLDLCLGLASLLFLLLVQTYSNDGQPQKSPNGKSWFWSRLILGLFRPSFGTLNYSNVGRSPLQMVVASKHANAL